MQPFFDGEVLSAWLTATTAWLLNEVFTPTHVVYTAMQIPAVVGTGFGAWWVHDFVYPALAQRIQHADLSDHGREILRALGMLLFPVLWILGLWVAGNVALYFVWPQNLLRMASHLLVAWVIIRLLSILVRDPVWSRAIIIVAFSVVTLKVLDLLDPTLELLNNLALTIGSFRISLLTVLKGMFYFGILLWAAIFVSAMLEKRVQRLPNLTPTVQVLFTKLLKGSLITLAVLVSLASAGIDFTALAVFGGALGVGIGFGLQKIISNLICGITLLMDKSIKPGDIIQIGETYGWVSSLGARYVSVETRDSTEFLIPNEEIITRQVINWSHRNKLARIKVQVRIAYSADVHKALKLMVEAAGRPSRVLANPTPRALLLGFGDSSMELELRFWIRDVQNGIRNISSDVMLEIWDLFRDNGIMIPIPRREIYLNRHPLSTALTDPDPAERPDPRE